MSSDSNEELKKMIKEQMLKDLKGFPIAIEIVEEEQENDPSAGIEDEMKKMMAGEASKDSNGSKVLNAASGIKVSNMMIGVIVFMCLNIFLFMYNMMCIQEYNSLLDVSKKWSIVYSLYSFFRDTFIYGVLEKMITYLLFTGITVYILYEFISLVVTKVYDYFIAIALGKSIDDEAERDKAMETKLKKMGVKVPGSDGKGQEANANEESDDDEDESDDEDDKNDDESTKSGNEDKTKEKDSGFGSLFSLPFGKGKMGGSGIMDMFGDQHKNKYRIEKKGKTGVTMADVAGCHIAKKELLELFDFLKHREKYVALGARLPKGALLYGPSGTGKTMIAKALANEVSYNYMYVQGSDFRKPLVGLGPTSVKEMFAKARKHSPCVIFIDEIDSILHKRGGGKTVTGSSSSSNEDDAIINTFLAEMDGFKDKGEIFILGATNRLDVIDKAALRPKRIDRVIHFKLPNVEERYEIIESYFKKMKVKEEMLSTEYMKLLAKKSFGFSGAQIYNMCNEAAIMAGQRDRVAIDEECMNDALDYIHLGKTEDHVKKNLSEDEKKRTAYHETGHAIVGIVMKELEKPTQISIVPHNKGSLGVTIAPVNEHKYSKTRDDYIAQLSMLLGGRMAEEVFIGNISSGAKDDLNKFNAIVDDYFHSGIEDIYMNDESDYQNRRIKTSDKYLEEMEEKKRNFIQNVTEMTKYIMHHNAEKIHAIAKELLEKEDMYEDDIKKYL
jgi:cell division protease FtsH